MVSSDLLSFISNMFGSLHNNSKIFSGVSILLVGDLAQLPPINGQPVFNSPVWKRFFPLFLNKSQRQKSDPTFYDLLQELRFGRLTEKSKKLIAAKINEPKKTENLITSTHLVSLRQVANEINELTSNSLPTNDESFGPFTSIAIDTINHETPPQNQRQYPRFSNYTNLPEKVIVREGARVMYLNNKLFDHNICNETIGVITNIIDNKNIEVTFPTTNDITKIIVQKETTYFDINGNPSTRRQFPLQNAFALTIHKTQGLTIPHTIIKIDEGIFATGQVYVAMSRAPSWESIDILDFDFSCVKTDESVSREYARLYSVY